MQGGALLPAGGFEWSIEMPQGVKSNEPGSVPMQDCASLVLLPLAQQDETNASPAATSTTGTLCSATPVVHNTNVSNLPVSSSAYI